MQLAWRAEALADSGVLSGDVLLPVRQHLQGRGGLAEKCRTKCPCSAAAGNTPSAHSEPQLPMQRSSRK